MAEPFINGKLLSTLQGVAERFMNGRCTIRDLTYNVTKKLYEPPFVDIATGVPCDIQSLATLQDPDVATYVKSLDISFQAYRRIAIPVGTATVRPDARIVTEPLGAGSSTYLVVQAVAPDETIPVELVLHCRKL